MQSASEARARLIDPSAEVSAHYLIDEDGSVECLVPEDLVAWHAGLSAWRAMNGLNHHSIGVEIVNPGHEWGYRPFPTAQIERVIALSHEIIRRHPIPASNILAHSDVAPARKQDPGELFPWQDLAAAGLGIWPDAIDCVADNMSAQEMLQAIGYRFDQAGTTLAHVITAFQRRYRPACVDGEVDSETMALIRGLAVAIDRI